MKKLILCALLAMLAIPASAATLARPIGTFKKKGVLRLGDKDELSAKTSQNMFEADSGCSGNNYRAGTASTVDGVTTVECGTGKEHSTVITFNTATLATIDTGTNMNASTNNGTMGFLLYTFPTNGIASIEDIRIDFETLTSNGTNIEDTPDIGIGTADATGTTETLLSAVTNGENILSGQTATGLNGEALRALSLDADFQVDTAAERTIYLNIADKFADPANGATISAPTGFIQINWKDFGSLDD